MASISETIWVHNDEELRHAVQRLVSQGGLVQEQQPDRVTVFVKKKINVPLLIVLLILGCLPGVVYLIWHLAANADQVATVRIGQPPNLGGYRPDDDGTDNALPPPHLQPGIPPGTAESNPGPSPPPFPPDPPAAPQEF